MPIFQSDLDQSHSLSFPQSLGQEPTAIERPPSVRSRRLSEVSIRTELCEGPVPDSPQSPTLPASTDDDHGPTSDRAELIQRLKRGQSPTWIPSHHVRNRSPQNEHVVPQGLRYSPPSHSIFTRAQSPKPLLSPKSPPEVPGLLPSAQITPEKSDPFSVVDERLRQGLEIERPRSALHSGDFTHDDPVQEGRRGEEHGPQGIADRLNHESTWAATSPPRHFTPFRFERHDHRANSSGSLRDISSPLSSSLSSSFLYQLPTSPLVQSESNEEPDLSMPLDHVDVPSASSGSRRHTLTAAASAPFASPSRLSLPRRAPLHRREGSLPYQAHQPRRSLTGTPSFAVSGTSPQTPAYLRSRRQSISSDSSPIQHASMVGSYEESILRGRMSTTPSKPLEFLAQIGVLGKGKCKSSLRCPAHVTLPFPAVYYSYSNNGLGRSQLDDGPSPYVGQIDLENGLHNTDDDSRTRRKAQSRYVDRQQADQDLRGFVPGHEQEVDFRSGTRSKRQSGSPRAPRAPPGGSYRVPEQGQIQIVIKNPNKTAVKLFLVPYDLAGMEPGTKTFIRQRSYSAGPIIDNVPVAAQLNPTDRPILRYLVHLHICCPSRGRYYLYKSIRIVFANRVPDGKEKLRNETTWPEPRFSPYKPIRVMHPPLSSSNGPGAMLAAEKAMRRRSLGVSMGSSSQAIDLVDGVFSSSHADIEHDMGRGSSDLGRGNTLPIEPVPFRLPRARFDSQASDITNAKVTDPMSSDSFPPSGLSTTDSRLDIWDPSHYEKLTKNDYGYGGYPLSPSGSRAGSHGAESLLSQRLRSLGVKTPALDPQED
ncbi:hypothetical protein HJFPF1_00496 [Paramyrothecium foliicola]|nr:hypothetical protein HJFPF1_00496 [Paramyrothecium foliicola]